MKILIRSFPSHIPKAIAYFLNYLYPQGQIRYLFGLSLFSFWLHLAAHGILVPRPGIKPSPPAVEVRSSNHWTTREVPWSFSCLFFFF